MSEIIDFCCTGPISDLEIQNAFLWKWVVCRRRCCRRRCRCRCRLCRRRRFLRCRDTVCGQLTLFNDSKWGVVEVSRLFL